MSILAREWDNEQVCKWLEARIHAAGRDQAADRRGYKAQDNYDKAAAEEWVCRSLTAAANKGDQAAFADRIKQLLGQDE